MLSNKIYKKYGDMWGELFRIRRKSARFYRTIDIYGKRPKNNRLYYRFSFYVGRFGVVRRRKTRYGKAFADKQKLKIFYNDAKESEIRFKWMKSLKYKGHAMFKFFHYMESRLDNLIYRANYVANMKQAQAMIEGGCVEVNGKIMYDKAYMVGSFQFVKLNIGGVMPTIIRRLIYRKFKMFPLPSYIDVDYSSSVILYLGVNSMPHYPFRFTASRLRTIYH